MCTLIVISRNLKLQQLTNIAWGEERKAKQAQVSQSVEMNVNVNLQGNDSSESHDVINLSSPIQTLDNSIPDASSHSKINPLVPSQPPACQPSSSHTSSRLPPPNNPGIQVVPIPSVSGQSKLPHQGNKWLTSQTFISPCILTNARSLKNKIPELRHLLPVAAPDLHSNQGVARSKNNWTRADDTIIRGGEQGYRRYPNASAEMAKPFRIRGLGSVVSPLSGVWGGASAANAF